MKTLILHIGRHKTGTTSIQAFLKGRAKILAKHGVCYPNTGRAPTNAPGSEAHHALVAMLMNHPPVDQIEATRKKLLAETEAAHTVVISSEGFQNLDNLDALKSLLRDFNVTVVCYLREMLSYAVSSYAEEVKSSAMVADFSVFAAYFTRALNYHAFAELWRQSFADLRFRLYDGGDIVEDFLNSCSLDKRAHFDPAEIRGRGNPSLSGNALGFKLMVNLLGLHDPAQKPVLQALSHEYVQFRGPTRVAPDVELMVRTGNQNNAFLARLFSDLTLRSFQNARPIMDRATWTRDFNTIATFMQRPAFAKAKTAELVRNPFFMALRFGPSAL